jgi:hypothetical protein
MRALQWSQAMRKQKTFNEKGAGAAQNEWIETHSFFLQ